MKYRIGTRKSELATVQAEGVRDSLRALSIDCDLTFIESSGDKDHTSPLYQMEATDPGLFTKQLEQALLDKQIEVAVHSLKDLPTLQPTGLVVAAVSKRVVADDVLLIAKKNYDPSSRLGLKKGATVGTSSLRREAQLLSFQNDLKIVPIRGNVPTRVKYVRDGKYDGVVLAQAGLHRLGLDLSDVVAHPLPANHFVSAPGQGALAIEARTDSSNELAKALEQLHDSLAARETRVERRILRELEGGCTLPLGVRCVTANQILRLTAFLGVLKDRHSQTHEWLSFHHFDMESADDEELVRKTVDYFRGVMNG